MRALLTDGDQRATLAAARALGRAGVAVIVGESAQTSLASRSRYCRAHVSYPSPYHSASSFLEAIVEAARSHSIDLVIPMTDITSAVLADRPRDFPDDIPVAVMDAASFWRASDKVSLDRLATEIGVPSPTLQTVIPEADGIAAALPPDWMDRTVFPCIVKPGRSRLKTATGWLRTEVRRAATRSDLERLLSTAPELAHPFLIQRVIDGEGVGVFALCDRGEPCMLFAHRRLREKPPSGGVSVLRESVPVDPAAGAYATALLRALRWHGVAMVEFKRERSTGIPYLMEINGRFWGSLQLAVDAGLNFPLELVRLWSGQPVTPNPSYQVGVRSRWLLGDFDHLLMRLRANGGSPPDATGIAALLWDFCRFFRRDTHYEIESMRDPGPSLHELGAYARSLIHARRGSRV